MPCAFLALMLGRELLALELQPPRISIERLLQRRDDDAGEPCFQTSDIATLELLFARGALAATRQSRDADDGVDDSKPGNRDLFFRFRSTLGRKLRAAAAGCRSASFQATVISGRDRSTLG